MTGIPQETTSGFDAKCVRKVKLEGVQVHASLAEWADSEGNFRLAAEREKDIIHAARAYFGAGVGVAKQQVSDPVP